MDTTKHPGTTTLSNLAAVSSRWEHEPAPIPDATRRCAWGGTGAAGAATAWLVLGGAWLGNQSLDGWPVGGRVVRWSLMGDLRTPAVALAAALCLAGLLLAWLTRGFAEAGPRLHWGLLGHAGFAALSGILPAAALAALVVTVAVIAAIAAALLAAVIGAIALFASSA